MSTPRDFGPVQLGDRLGLARHQVERALVDGLIPPADVHGRRWSAAVVEHAAEHAAEIRAAVGSLPDLGAARAADLLSDRFGIPVDPGVLIELARLGAVPTAGTYRDATLYCGRVLETFTDRAALEQAIEHGRLLTADQAATHLRIRRSDFDHLVRTGLLCETTRVRSSHRRRRSDPPTVPLYRIGDLNTLADRSDIDWDTIRATPPGRPSPLARLTSPPER